MANGYQTAGNLFDLEAEATKEIQEVLRYEINNYYLRFKIVMRGLIKYWPTRYSLMSWIVNMRSGGELRPHMHEGGWISGSVYINVPAKQSEGSGNLVVCIEEDDNCSDSAQSESIDVITGSLCLFPASFTLYHSIFLGRGAYCVSLRYGS